MKWLAALVLSACLLVSPAQAGDQRIVEPDLERTWWELCWQATKEVPDLERPVYPKETYPHAKPCKDAKPLSWPENRVRYFVAGSVTYPDLVKLAAEQWNEWAGREVFVEVGVDENPDMLVIGKTMWGAAGRAQHYKQEGKLKVLVTLDPTGKRPYRISLHELGHVLGFGHDITPKDSIMNGAPYTKAVKLTAKDYDALRAKYGPEANKVSRRFTEHVLVEDLACRCGMPVPEEYYDNAVEISRRFEILRKVVGKLKITSGYRTATYNAKVGGAKQSWHLRAGAIDLRSRYFTPKQLAQIYEGLVKTGVVPDGGIGVYKSHIHIDIGEPRRWKK